MGRISTMSIVNGFIDFYAAPNKLAALHDELAALTAEHETAAAAAADFKALLKENKGNAALTMVYNQYAEKSAALAAQIVDCENAIAAAAATLDDIAAYGDIKPLMLKLFDFLETLPEIAQEDTDKRRAEYRAALISGTHTK